MAYSADLFMSSGGYNALPTNAPRTANHVDVDSNPPLDYGIYGAENAVLFSVDHINHVGTNLDQLHNGSDVGTYNQDGILHSHYNHINAWSDNNASGATLYQILPHQQPQQPIPCGGLPFNNGSRPLDSDLGNQTNRLAIGALPYDASSSSTSSSADTLASSSISPSDGALAFDPYSTASTLTSSNTSPPTKLYACKGCPNVYSSLQALKHHRWKSSCKWNIPKEVYETVIQHLKQELRNEPNWRELTGLVNEKTDMLLSEKLLWEMYADTLQTPRCANCRSKWGGYTMHEDRFIMRYRAKNVKALPLSEAFGIVFSNRPSRTADGLGGRRLLLETSANRNSTLQDCDSNPKDCELCRVADSEASRKKLWTYWEFLRDKGEAEDAIAEECRLALPFTVSYNINICEKEYACYKITLSEDEVLLCECGSVWVSKFGLRSCGRQHRTCKARTRTATRAQTQRLTCMCGQLFPSIRKLKNHDGSECAHKRGFYKALGDLQVPSSKINKWYKEWNTEWHAASTRKLERWKAKTTMQSRREVS
ncbi:hypothetical protein HJFPF1_13617 [Paramyrothecium foliicola]|nr:hypothetical protein HJFPF1_13617 [Paramyrothecium foliicola]